MYVWPAMTTSPSTARAAWTHRPKRVAPLSECDHRRRRLERRPRGCAATAWDGAGRWLLAIIDRCLNKAPPERFQSAVRVGDGEDVIRLREQGCGLAAPAGRRTALGSRAPKLRWGWTFTPADDPVDSMRSTTVARREPALRHPREGHRRDLVELKWRSGRFRPISAIPPDFEISNGMSWVGR
jgi:hypothetical protein